MNFVDKLKDWFGDEEEDEIRTEKTKVEISSPQVEKYEREEISESQALKKEDKSVPVFFDDEDFQEISLKERVLPARKVNKLEEPKRFRPTPIISPVYGILDKNYSKEQITQKQKPDANSGSGLSNTKGISLDEIRKKAYGTLDDELEQELVTDRHVFMNEEFVEEKDLFDELEEKEDEEIVEEVVESREQRRKTVIEDDEKNVLEEEFFKTQEKRVTEEPQEDLFNLIDTMYEKGGDEWRF